MPEFSATISHNSLLSPKIKASICPRMQKGVICRHLMSSEDDGVALLQHNKLVWSREEALASISLVEMMELPMSDRDQTIETEFDQKESEFIYLFIYTVFFPIFYHFLTIFVVYLFLFPIFFLYFS